ncbi:MAG: addiction module protein [Chlorobium phaeobacteroides]|uniref:Addiction module component, TIGR02574 family n=1 Tax=Chlorobium phaeobacteroides (strain BS1) TaxID=331678 RepID=B3EK68_CHLPB|nr:addiction module protein [Chlorobium phaeobacteroides]MBL6956715.1 addiction module protein [Chlorobium phaeobacteroides]
MKTELHNLSIDERLRLVEDIWDSIAADQGALPLTDEQKAELDQRLDIYELDKSMGRVADEVIDVIKKKL